VETLKRKKSSYLCRWLGLSSVALYGRSNKLQLPISSFDEEFRVPRTREALLYRVTLERCQWALRKWKT